MKNVENHIRNIVPDNDQYILGFADLRGLVPSKYEGHDYAIVLGKRLEDKIVDTIASGPTIEYYNHFIETNNSVSQLMNNISEMLKTEGISYRIVDPTVYDDDLDKYYKDSLRVEFSHKMAATRAGLGWVGKTDLLITFKFGPRLRFGTILIDHPLKCSNVVIDESQCGKCNLCVEKCPGKAATGKSWDTTLDRNEFYDPFKCQQISRQLSREKYSKNKSVCGLCVYLCPHGRYKQA